MYQKILTAAAFAIIIVLVFLAFMFHGQAEEHAKKSSQKVNKIIATVDSIKYHVPANAIVIENLGNKWCLFQLGASIYMYKIGGCFIQIGIVEDDYVTEEDVYAE